MFSYSGLTPDQVDRLRSDFAVYAIESGRICVAALNVAISITLPRRLPR